MSHDPCNSSVNASELANGMNQSELFSGIKQTGELLLLARHELEIQFRSRCMAMPMCMYILCEFFIISAETLFYVFVQKRKQTRVLRA
jgi:hypothetical protein